MLYTNAADVEALLKLRNSLIPCFRYHLLISSITETFQLTFCIVAKLRIGVEYTYNVIH
jgi:hypothetical protein